MMSCSRLLRGLGAALSGFVVMLAAETTHAQSLTPKVEDPEVAIVVYSSYACRYCATWAQQLRDLVRQYPDRLAVIVRPFPLDAARESWAIAAARALAEQGRFAELHESLFAQQSGQVSMAEWRRRAAKAGVDLVAFDTAVERHVAMAAEAVLEARAHGVRVTPTTFVDGFRFDGLPSLDAVTAVIAARLESPDPAKPSVAGPAGAKP